MLYICFVNKTLWTIYETTCEKLITRKTKQLKFAL